MLLRLAAFSLLMCMACSVSQAQGLNTLSAQEKKDGWKLLFNGRDLQGWHRYNGKGVPNSWKIEANALHLDIPKVMSDIPRDGGDLTTDAIISGDFAFKAEFKLEKFTNSGIFFFVEEKPQNVHIYDTGMEAQIGDDALYGEDRKVSHHSGDLFAIAPVRIEEVLPLGSWNKMEVTMQKNKLTLVVNGFVVQEHDLNSADWKQHVKAGKMKDSPFAKGKFTGRIGLQDWNTSVWFRNIKLRQL